MDPKFAVHVESLHGSFERLLAMPPLTTGALPSTLPTAGIYLFTEAEKHLYVGRSRNIRRRYGRHTQPGSRQNSAALAMLLAMEEARGRPGHKPSPRKGLALNKEFDEMFALQKARIRRMDFRCVEEPDPVRQTLLEVYCAIVLGTPYNDFDTH